MRRITKYANRKLYDEESVSYVSMLELSDLVAGGARVAVTCDVTGQDITLETLSRALYERVKVRDLSGPQVTPGALAGLIKRVRRLT
jgi:polyhydroxyalkanoate synthesis regulator protein